MEKISKATLRDAGMDLLVQAGYVFSATIIRDSLVLGFDDGKTCRVHTCNFHKAIVKHKNGKLDFEASDFVLFVMPAVPLGAHREAPENSVQLIGDFIVYLVPAKIAAAAMKKAHVTWQKQSGSDKYKTVVVWFKDRPQRNLPTACKGFHKKWAQFRVIPKDATPKLLVNVQEAKRRLDAIAQAVEGIRSLLEAQ
jgi:hypothetical protein